MLRQEDIQRIQEGIKREYGVDDRDIAEVFGNLTYKSLTKGVQDYFQLNQALKANLPVTDSSMNEAGQLFGFLQKYDSVVADFQRSLITNEGDRYQVLRIYQKALQDLSQGKDSLEALSVFGMFMGQSTKQLNKHLSSNDGSKREELLGDLRESLIVPVGKIYRPDFELLEPKVKMGYESESIKERRTILPFEYTWNVLNRVAQQQK